MSGTETRKSVLLFLHNRSIITIAKLSVEYGLEYIEQMAQTMDVEEKIIA